MQGSEAFEHAALRKDEAWLAHLREELSTAELSLRNVDGQIARAATDVVAGGITSNAGGRLLAQLVQRESTKVESVHQESAEIRAAIARAQDLANCNKREALLLGDAREAVLALLEAAPRHLDSRADALRQALVRTQNDIELLREGGRDVSCRSAEVADEFRAVEVELQAERADRDLAWQRERAASHAANEQQRVSHFFGITGLGGRQTASGCKASPLPGQPP